ncbi:GNAT family N-acetyltransferase [Leifsonia sp. NPDC080035]|uniref:GNAT family N-acetyltransferase n=1 Tax=Leifsonia sp. NPDC080035 TaxID=3143936 RepID=A0AAU7GEG2_9MICO
MALRTVELRPATDADAAFLERVFLDVRRDEFPGVPESELAPILALQLRAHTAELTARHPRAETSIILDGGEPVGTVTVDRDGSRMHLVDIAVLAEHRGRGVASTVLSGLIDDGEHITLSVWALNAGARRLYERLGFAVVAEQFGYVLMATGVDG